MNKEDKNNIFWIWLVIFIVMFLFVSPLISYILVGVGESNFIFSFVGSIVVTYIAYAIRQ